MTKSSYQIIISSFLISAVLVFAVNFFVFASFNEPSQNPPNGNVAAPINVGSASQYKTGRLGVKTSGIDPNYGLTVGDDGIKVTGNSYFEGDITADRIYDRGNTSYYLDPAGTSHLNKIDFGSGYIDDDGSYFKIGHESRAVYIRSTGGHIYLYPASNKNLYLGMNGNSQKIYIRGGNQLCLNGDCIDSWNDVSGGISGSGSNGRVAFWTGNSSLGSDTDFTWIKNDNKLRIGDDLSIGYRSGSDSDYLYFDRETQYLRWNNSNGRFEFSNDVAAGAFFYNSDARLKEDIMPLEDSLDKILKLQGVSFRWKKNGEASIGLIAQDVEKIYPEIVTTDSDTNLKSINYSALVAPLIEAIKAQQKEIEELKAEIKELKEGK